MQRCQQVAFAVSVVALSWLAMLAVHEAGHVAGALATGGSVQRVVLYPLGISRTDVAPNPQPGVVVWCGPLVGCLLPLAVFAIMPRRRVTAGKLSGFFAGCCLIANGAYISLGSFSGVGDCGDMLRSGTPLGAMLAFGALTVPLGLFLWHRLGSLTYFLQRPSLVTRGMALSALAALAAVLAAGVVLSPR